MRCDAPLSRDRASGNAAFRPGRVDERAEAAGMQLGRMRDARTVGVRPLVLVVDDEVSLRGLLAELLEGAGYAVRTAENGIAALAMLQHERPAVVLTDYTMPGLDGPGLIRRMRNSPVTRHIPIIAMSATRPPGATRGDVPFIEKPFDVDEVLDAIALHTCGPYANDAFSYDEFASPDPVR